MDFEVDDLPGVFLLAQPIAKFIEGHMVHDDVLAGHAAAAVLAGKIRGVKQVDHFRSHARRGGGGEIGRASCRERV